MHEALSDPGFRPLFDELERMQSSPVSRLNTPRVEVEAAQSPARSPLDALGDQVNNLMRALSPGSEFPADNESDDGVAAAAAPVERRQSTRFKKPRTLYQHE